MLLRSFELVALENSIAWTSSRARDKMMITVLYEKQSILDGLNGTRTNGLGEQVY